MLVSFWGICVLLLQRFNAHLSPLVPTLAVALSTLGAGWVALATERARADSEDRRRQRTHDFMWRSLTALTEMRDPYTGRHARRTQAYAQLLLERLSELAVFKGDLTPERMAASVSDGSNSR